MQEKIIQTKTCKHCNSSFEITDKDLEFYEKISPSFNGKKYNIPTPSLCPDCRNKRRLSWRNEQNLYKRKCNKTGKDIVSMYSPDKNLIVYDKEFWNSDKFDVMKYGLDIDFSKSFFSQFQKLLQTTPLPSLTVSFESENSEYNIYSGKMKDCYMIFASWECQNTMYSSRLIKTSHVIDSLDGTSLEKCYQIVNSENCFGCFYVINSSNSSNCSFSYDLSNCNDCLLCYNLVGKKYCIENIEYSREDYLEKSQKLKKELFSKGWQVLKEIEKKVINRNLMMVACEDSVGDNLKNCKNCDNCFHFEEAENCKYSENGGMKCYSSYDGRGLGGNLQFGYEILDTGIDGMINCFLISCYTCNNVFYSMNCHNSSNLFGCLGLKNKEYCIFNKQYTKDEYEQLVPKIIESMVLAGEWGEFFPSTISIFGYNESAAIEYFPLTRDYVIPAKAGISGKEKLDKITKDSKDIFTHSDELIDSVSSTEGQLLHGKVFNRTTYESPFPKVEKIIHASMLPDDISQIPDDILNWAIECEVSGKPFKIVYSELDFYRKNNLPIPKRHPSVRHLDRVKLTNGKKIFERNCDKCGKNMKTVFPPEDKRKVYCEVCYEKEVY